MIREKKKGYFGSHIICNRQHNNQNFGREIIHTTMYIKIQNYKFRLGSQRNSSN